jgi:Tfp pilus assembly protein PilN
MIQINLVPDVKYEHLKASRTRNIVNLTAIIVSAFAIGITILLAAVAYGAQKANINKLNEEIAASSQELQSIQDLDKILTVQNQLNSVDGLHDSKPVTSRLYQYLPQLVPTNVQVSDIEFNFTDNTFIVEGTAKDLLAVNKFVDTIKFTEYTQEGSDVKTRAFSEVVLDSFESKQGETAYTIKGKFDPTIFSGTVKVKLEVPKVTTTRAESNPGTDLFKEQPKEENQ